MKAPGDNPYGTHLRRIRDDRLARTLSAVPESSPFHGAPADLKAEILARTQGLEDEMFDLARVLHARPELAFEEHRSVAAIVELLARHDVDVTVGAYRLPTAFRAAAGSGSPRVAIIAEYDALPEVGHGCGHNLIAASAIGAFLALRPWMASLGGTVELVGAPGEEGGGGKQLIIESGGFDGIDAAMMFHPDNRDRVFDTSLGMRQVEVRYTGRAAHASATPYLGRNALDAAITAYQAIAQLRQHILDSDRVHGIITDGGQAPNVVPERASAHFFVRSGTVDTLEILSARVDEILHGAALTSGVDVEVCWDRQPAYLPMRVNAPLASRFVVNLADRRQIEPRSVATVGGGSTDMGNVSQLVPSIHPYLAISPEDVGTHTADFAAWTLTANGRRGFTDAMVGLATTAADVLADAALRAAITADFEVSGGSLRWQGGASTGAGR